MDREPPRPWGAGASGVGGAADVAGAGRPVPFPRPAPGPVPRFLSGLRAAVARVRRRRAQTSADAGLARALHDRVEAAGLPASGLAFYVHDGVVSVYGGVADRAAREALIDVVVEARGVRRVVDHLRIGEP